MTVKNGRTEIEVTGTGTGTGTEAIVIAWIGVIANGTETEIEKGNVVGHVLLALETRGCLVGMLSRTRIQPAATTVSESARTGTRGGIDETRGPGIVIEARRVAR